MHNEPVAIFALLWQDQSLFLVRALANEDDFYNTRLGIHECYMLHCQRLAQNRSMIEVTRYVEFAIAGGRRVRGHPKAPA